MSQYVNTVTNQAWEAWQLPIFDPQNIPDFINDQSIPQWVRDFMSAGHLYPKSDGLWYYILADGTFDAVNQETPSQPLNWQTMNVSNNSNPPYKVVDYQLCGKSYFNENTILAPEGISYNFEYALSKIKQGYSVARAGWDKQDFLVMVRPIPTNYGYVSSVVYAPNEIPTANASPFSWIGRSSEDKPFVQWTPTADDLLAEDWNVS